MHGATVGADQRAAHGQRRDQVFECFGPRREQGNAGVRGPRDLGGARVVAGVARVAGRTGGPQQHESNPRVAAEALRQVEEVPGRPGFLRLARADVQRDPAPWTVWKARAPASDSLRYREHTYRSRRPGDAEPRGELHYHFDFVQLLVDRLLGSEADDVPRPQAARHREAVAVEARLGEDHVVEGG